MHTYDYGRYPYIFTLYIFFPPVERTLFAYINPTPYSPPPSPCLGHPGRAQVPYTAAGVGPDSCLTGRQDSTDLRFTTGTPTPTL